MTTGQQIWDQALDYFDDAGEGFVDTDQQLRHINTALSEIHELLAKAKNSDYFNSSTDITLVAGTATYALPADFYKLQGAFYVTGSGSSERLWPLQRFQVQEIGGYRQSPLSGGTVRLWYVPTFTELTLIGGTIDTLVFPGWEDYASLQIACRLDIKEESMEQFQMVKAERDRKFALITSEVEPRDDFVVDSIADLSGRFESPARRLVGQEERWIKYRIMGDNIRFVENEFRGL